MLTAKESTAVNAITAHLIAIEGVLATFKGSTCAVVEEAIKEFERVILDHQAATPHTAASCDASS